jgi:hypothetical protein
MHRAMQAGEAYRALVTALQQHQDKASKQRMGKFGHSTADEMHFSLASLEVCAAVACATWTGMYSVVVPTWRNSCRRRTTVAAMQLFLLRLRGLQVSALIHSLLVQSYVHTTEEDRAEYFRQWGRQLDKETTVLREAVGALMPKPRQTSCTA